MQKFDELVTDLMPALKLIGALGVAALVVWVVACSEQPRLFVEQRCAGAAPVPEQLECFKNCVDNDSGNEEAEDRVYACEGVCRRMLCPKETVVFVQGTPEDAIPCARASGRMKQACERHGARP
jgi:hypothetical protein